MSRFFDRLVFLGWMLIPLVTWLVFLKYFADTITYADAS